MPLFLNLLRRAAAGRSEGGSLERSSSTLELGGVGAPPPGEGGVSTPSGPLDEGVCALETDGESSAWMNSSMSISASSTLSASLNDEGFFKMSFFVDSGK